MCAAEGVWNSFDFAKNLLSQDIIVCDLYAPTTGIFMWDVK